MSACVQQSLLQLTLPHSRMNNLISFFSDTLHLTPHPRSPQARKRELMLDALGMCDKRSAL